MEAENSETKKKSVMVWSEAKDLLILSAVAAEGVFNHNQGSRERGSAWQRAASTLCAQEGNFNVTARFVRDRFNVLAKKLRVKLSREEKESGGGYLDQSDVENLLEELLELSDECDRRTDETEAKKECAESEKKRALEMREREMERFGETSKRKEEEEDEPRKVKQRRRSGGEAIDWLKEKAAAMNEVKEKEIQERKEERELQQQQLLQVTSQFQQAQIAYQQEMKTLQSQMLHQIQQQQQQKQQFAMPQQQLMMLMQQQSQALNALLKKV